MISFLKAVCYAAFHPYETVYITVVRRYADAKKHFIGELYVGEGRTAKMIGMSCDNLPLKVEGKTAGHIRWGRDFTESIGPNTILAGGIEPRDQAAVHDFFSLRRFCLHRVSVLNRFVEHVLENENV